MRGTPRRPPLKRSRKFDPKPIRRPVLPKLLRYLLALVAAVIVIDALFGDQGLADTMRARRQYAALEAHVARVKAENAALREEARQLKEEPARIEWIARDELGLIMPGEQLFIIADETLPHPR
ncbi:MAG TPA: septum formation initiator family protein [Vicinamibacterales bacterium]|nr:septum formation initiator family protein [Vicinamibacterales bacterium]